METFKINTIGFTKSTAERFFERLKIANVKTVLDVRLNTVSQLSGFAKSTDLPYLLKNIAGISYRHVPILAPEDDILKAYKRDGGSWEVYEKLFLDLMARRRIEEKLKPSQFEDTCLLCSEAEPHHCHRRLVCDYLNSRWGGALAVRHL